MLVIGLTGGIATGKSTVSNMIKEYNIPIIDADKISREIMEPGSKGLKEICDQFSKDILNLDGTLNRKKLGKIVFNDIVKLKKLNSITHPLIKEKIKEEISIHQFNAEKLCLVDAALLIEENFTDLVNYIILIYTDTESQIQRLIIRDNISENEAIKRINAQMSFEEKKKNANFIIDNSKDIEYTKVQLNKILGEIIASEGING